VQGEVCRGWGLGIRVKGLEFRVYRVGCRVQDTECRVQVEGVWGFRV
jgi:hypothetical protein